jgi:hypothetical protein
MIDGPDIVDWVGEIEGFGPCTSVVEDAGRWGLVKGVLIGCSLRGITLSPYRGCGLIGGRMKATCQGIVRDKRVCLQVGGE